MKNAPRKQFYQARLSNAIKRLEKMLGGLVKMGDL